MFETLIQEILQQIEQPKQDLEHNLRALLAEAISQMDLVSKEELSRQQTALDLAHQRMDQLIKHIERLEAQLQDKK